MSELAVRRLDRRGFHAVGVVPGIGLAISEAGARSWVLRYSMGGKRRHYGIGPYPLVGLAEAREEARKARALIRAGVDPIEARKARKQAATVTQNVLTFQQCCDAYIKTHRSKWKSEKHVSQWESTLRDFAGPVMGALPVNAVTTAHVMRVLEPKWRETTETLVRLRGRIESVLDFATVHGHRQGENVARWKGHLSNLLPEPGKVAKRGHFKMLAYAELPALWERLVDAPGISAAALRWTILTAARSGETRGMVWQEIDGDVWTVPAERAKTGKLHRVPLTSAMLALLPARGEPDELVFPGLKGQLSDMSLGAVLRRLGVDTTVHGFRASFRTWAAERTSYPHAVVERCLAHIVESAVAQAYQRSDYLDQRREIMTAWGEYVLSI
jgi:integrase